MTIITEGTKMSMGEYCDWAFYSTTRNAWMKEPTCCGCGIEFALHSVTEEFIYDEVSPVCMNVYVFCSSCFCVASINWLAYEGKPSFQVTKPSYESI